MTRPRGRCCSTSSSSCCPAPSAAGQHWKGHHLPLSGWRWDQPDGRLLLVGDAAGLINPMTGEGIYYAIATGIAAGPVRGARPARRAATRGPCTGRRCARLLGRHLKHTFVASRLAEHPVIVDGGIRVARRDRRVFDELVELGLGDGRISGRLVRGLVAGLGRKAVSGLRGSLMQLLTVRGALPPHRHSQAEITDAFAGVIARGGGLDERLLRRFHANAGVEFRHTVLPL